MEATQLRNLLIKINSLSLGMFRSSLNLLLGLLEAESPLTSHWGYASVVRRMGMATRSLWCLFPFSDARWWRNQSQHWRSKWCQCIWAPVHWVIVQTWIYFLSLWSCHFFKHPFFCMLFRILKTTVSFHVVVLVIICNAFVFTFAIRHSQSIICLLITRLLLLVMNESSSYLLSARNLEARERSRLETNEIA